MFYGYEAATAYETPASILRAKILQAGWDPDGHALTVGAVAPATREGGSAEIIGNYVRYTPPAGFWGEDIITVTIRDAFGATASGPLTVTVRPPANAGGPNVVAPSLTPVPGGGMPPCRPAPPAALNTPTRTHPNPAASTAFTAGEVHPRGAWFLVHTPQDGHPDSAESENYLVTRTLLAPSSGRMSSFRTCDPASRKAAHARTVGESPPEAGKQPPCGWTWAIFGRITPDFRPRQISPPSK